MAFCFDFAIVGAPKAATTSLVDYLRSHADIFLPEQKEIPYFVDDEAFAQGVAYLDSVYAGVRKGQKVGIAHVHMLHADKPADRLRAHSPDAKIIAVLREPVDRAYSAFWHMRKLGWEDAATFEEALARESEQLKTPYADRTDFGYLRDGEYAAQIMRYVDRFGGANVRSIFTDDLASNAAGTVAEIVSWLGLSPDLIKADFQKRSNVAAKPRSAVLHWVLARPYGLKRLYKALMPMRLQYRIRTRLKDPLMARNLEQVGYPPMNPTTRRRLEEHFTPHNERLERLIGRPLPAAWKPAG
jgi:hypothetical protein